MLEPTAQRTGGAVKLALVKVKPTDKGNNRAVLRVNGDQRRVDVRDLRQPPAVTHFANPDLLPGLHDVVDFTRSRPLLRIGDKATSPAHAVHRQ